MLLPGSFSGRISSPSPQRGPLPSKHMSFAIFIREAEIVFTAPLLSTKASCAAKASNLFSAVTKGRFVSSATAAAILTSNPFLVFKPVPTAVPP
uniref:Pco106335 n=1 Tax=Arundo donax TaxID=35708 RepID=A0A0A9D6C4_ARUDO